MSKSSPRLGKVQLQIMQVLWERHEATARQITETLSQTAPIAHSTVQTLLRKLEVKGAVIHEARERVFIFKPLFQERDVTQTAARDLLNRLFSGSVSGLVAHLLQSEPISAEERAELRRLIDSSEEGQLQ